MVELDIKANYDRLSRVAIRLKNRIQDMSGVFDRFAKMYSGLARLNIIQAGGKIMMGRAYAELTEPYRTRKMKEYGAQPILKRTGDLLEAIGSPKTIIGKQSLTMELDGPEYGKYLEKGTSKMAKRSYWSFQGTGRMPQRALLMLVKQMDMELVKEIKRAGG
jgi:hypothetical protein